MEFNATVGFELGALLAPELAGLANVGGPNVSSEQPQGDPAAAPFSLALLAAQLVVATGGAPRPGGNDLPFPTSTTTVTLPTVAPAAPPILASLAVVDPAIAARRIAADVVESAYDAAPARPRPGPPSAQAAAAPLQVIDAELLAVPADVAAPAAATAALPASAAVQQPVARSDAARRPTIEAPTASAVSTQDSARFSAAVTREAVAADAAAPAASGPLAAPQNGAAHPDPAAPAVIALATPERRELATFDTSARPTDADPGLVTAPPAAGGSSTAPRSVAPPVTADAPVPAGPDFSDRIAERLHLLVDHRIDQARIKLNPPDLGALDVKITIAEDRTYVQIVASHAGARDALEAALPKLRMLLEAAGLELGGASVGGEPGARDGVFAAPSPAVVAPDSDAPEALEAGAPHAAPVARDDAVDLFV